MSAKKLLPLSGVATVLLVFAAHLFHGAVPSAKAPAQVVADLYRTHDTGQTVGGMLIMLGAFSFLVFGVVLRHRLRDAAASGDATTFGFAGAIVFAVGLSTFAGIGVTLGDVADHLDPSALQTLNALYNDLFLPIALGGAVFLIGFGIPMIATGTLPKWLGWVAIVFGVVSLTPLGVVGFAGLGVWLLIASVLLMVRPEPA